MQATIYKTIKSSLKNPNLSLMIKSKMAIAMMPVIL